jgi:hypothetical protein
MKAFLFAVPQFVVFLDVPSALLSPARKNKQFPYILFVEFGLIFNEIVYLSSNI